MSKTNRSKSAGFPVLLKEIKDRIQQAQTCAILSVNAELVQLYWDIGRIIAGRQEREGWGAAVIPRLALELRNELPDEKGFSERNIKRMLAFYREYSHGASFPPQFPANPPVTPIVPPSVAQFATTDFLPKSVAKLKSALKVPQAAAKLPADAIVQQAVAQLPNSLLWSIPWAHHVLLIEKVKDRTIRNWYMQQTLLNGWSRNVLLLMIKSEAHARQGKAVNNFERVLPAPQSDLVQQTLKDPYIFDFLTLQEPFHERELETNLLHQLEKFLLELGQGFAFVGRQYNLKVGDRDYSVDLLFYHLKLRRFFVIDLKKGEFKPEYAGKMNFYLSVIDDQLRHESDDESIGLILCQDRNHVVAEYALRGENSPIGVSEYELTRALPSSLKSALPTVEQIEAELDEAVAEKGKEQAALPAPIKKKTTKTSKSKKKKQPQKDR